MTSEAISKIYAEVPDAGCKGLCQRACGPILMSTAERLLLLAKYDTEPMPGVNLTCSKLIEGRCSIYADRPLICRLYGTTRQLKCEHGCQPRGGFMSEHKAGKLIRRMQRVRP